MLACHHCCMQADLSLPEVEFGFLNPCLMEISPRKKFVIIASKGLHNCIDNGKRSIVFHNSIIALISNEINFIIYIAIINAIIQYYVTIYYLNNSVLIKSLFTRLLLKILFTGSIKCNIYYHILILYLSYKTVT